MMFSAYERSRSRVTRSLTRSWSSLANSPSATVRPILRFCLHVPTEGGLCLILQTWHHTEWERYLCFLFFVFLLDVTTHTHTSLPEVLKVLLDVREQRVLKCLNMLSVYFLWDQLCSPPFCKHMHIHSGTLSTKHQGAVSWAGLRTKAWHSKPLISQAHKMISLMRAKTQNDIVQTT